MVDNFFSELNSVLPALSSPPSDDTTSAQTHRTLHLPDVKPADESTLRAFWKQLRAFYRDGQSPVAAKDLFPALLSTYRDFQRVQHDYPLWIPSDGSAVRSWSALLDEAIENTGRLLKDNARRLDWIVRQTANGAIAWVVAEALKTLKQQLHLSEGDAASLEEDIHRLSFPTQGQLISFSQTMPLQLMAAAIAHQTMDRAPLREEARLRKNRLEELLRLEISKRATTPESTKSSYGYGSVFLDFERISTVQPASASEAIPEARWNRLQSIQKTLNKWGEDPLACIVTSDDLIGEVRRTFPQAAVSSISETAVLFDRHMAEMAERMKALRIARLEEENKYNPEVHDAYFADFDWRAFTEDEIRACPPVIRIVTLDQMMKELTETSGLLATSRPIRYLTLRTHVGETAFEFHREPGALAISHRNTFVMQSTLLHPERAFQEFVRGLRHSSPALFYVMAPHSESPYLWAGAALEGRAFPEFVYDPRQGDAWGSRFVVEQNPQTDRNWPEYELRHGTKDEYAIRIPFTFADFAALEPSWQMHFLPVDPQFWTDDLIPYADYLRSTECYANIPFIWMVNAEGTLHKVALSHFLVLSGQERLDFWHFLQEFGGVNNYHVQLALKNARERFDQEKEAALNEMEERHRSAIEIVREETAREALAKLADSLLGLEAMPISSSSVVPPPTESTSETVVVPARAEEEVVISTEAWIETMRCTSCNECLNVNPNCFQYDGNKQAFIADARAATFAQLVTAAEKCPAKCIHPGAPLNPSEAGLDDLIRRAAKFG